MALADPRQPSSPADAVPRWAVVAPEGEIDLATAASLEAQLLRAARTDVVGVVADFGRVTFVDASGVAALVRVRADLARRAQELVVRDPSRLLTLMLELFGMADMIEAGVGSRPRGADAAGGPIPGDGAPGAH